MYGGLFSRWNTIPGDSQRSGDGNDGGSTCADLALDSSIIASIISRQFSPKPFYHFAAGRFRQRMQEQQAEDLRRNEIQDK